MEPGCFDPEGEMNMQMRYMAESDYDQVIALWTACPEVELNSADDSREGIARFLRRNPDTCFVAEEEGQLVGVILSGSDGRRGYIYHAAVPPAMRGRGVGSMLVRAVLEKMHEAGVGKVGLLTFRDNEAGHRFWAKFGFVVRDDLYYHSNVLVPMQRL